MAPIMDALADDRHGCFTVNLPDRRALLGIPENGVVVVAAVNDCQGIRPIAVDPFPEWIMPSAPC